MDQSRGVDSNLTRTESLASALWIAMVKGRMAGPGRQLVALAIGLQRELATAKLLAAGVPMLAGVVLHITEHPTHAYRHSLLEHSREHTQRTGDAHL